MTLSVVSMIMRYGVQYWVGSTFFSFFPIYTSNQNSVCTLGCLEPVEGIKKVLTFPLCSCVLNFYKPHPPLDIHNIPFAIWIADLASKGVLR